MQRGSRGCCCFDVRDDVIVKALLDEGIVMVHVRGNEIVCLCDDMRLLLLIKELKQVFLLFITDVDDIFHAKHEHNGHDGRLDLREVFGLVCSNLG